MFHKGAVAGLALAGLIASSTASLGMVGVNCLTLSDYYRALGTIENGADSCGMSMAEANRVLGRTNAVQATTGGNVALPTRRIHVRRKHHHLRTFRQN